MRFKNYLLFFFGFAGNQPFSTLFFCSKISSMLQNEENAVTPVITDQIRLLISTDATTFANPKIRNSHHDFVPR